MVTQAGSLRALDRRSASNCAARPPVAFHIPARCGTFLPIRNHKTFKAKRRSVHDKARFEEFHSVDVHRVVVAVATVLGWVGMLNLVRAARSLYLGRWVGNFVLILLRGPVVSASAPIVIMTISALVGGAILWIVYFSELRAEFRRLSEVVGAAKENTA